MEAGTRSNAASTVFKLKFGRVVVAPSEPPHQRSLISLCCGIKISLSNLPRCRRRRQVARPFTNIVYTGFVGSLKNITLSASSETIERARLRAREQRTTLNAAFREWLERYSGGRPTAAEYRQIMGQLRHVRPGRKFTREEMNQRAPQS